MLVLIHTSPPETQVALSLFAKVLTIRAVACGVADRLRLVAMSRYVLGHRLEGEKKRLALMSLLLDPMRKIEVETAVSDSSEILREQPSYSCA